MKRKVQGLFTGDIVFRAGTRQGAERAVASLKEVKSLTVGDPKISGEHPSVDVRVSVLYLAHGAWDNDVQRKASRAIRRAKVHVSGLRTDRGKHTTRPDLCTRTECRPCEIALARGAGAASVVDIA
jgi:hypothetical protein